MKMNVPDFINLFNENIKLETYVGEGVTKTVHLGVINISSGQVVACDPLVLGDIKPFSVKIIPGEYPILLSIIHFTNDDERIGAAMIKFKDDHVVRWKMALKEEQDITTLQDCEIFGYPVDTGVGCFMDYQTALKYKEIIVDNPQYDERILEAMKMNYADTRDWTNYQIDPSSNIVTFSTGLGDGYYASYWGYNDKNEICCLVSDFDLYRS